MITRRTLLGVLGAVAVSQAVPSRAQPSADKLRRIGFLGSGSAASVAKPLVALKEKLRDLGYVEGRNFVFDLRWADGSFERLPGLLSEMLRQKPDLVMTWGTPATAAAKRATSSVPIVMCNTGDPDATGLIASLARPGGNITGVANLGGNVAEKQVEMFAQLIPGMGRIGVLRNPDNASLVTQLGGAESAARRLGMQVQVVDARRPADLDAAFARFVEAHAAGVVVLADPFFFDQGRRIAELAAKNRLPTVSARSEIADAGIMVTYGASTVEQFRTAALYADKILKGAKPADLPVEQASKFELVINLKVARTLGINIPESVLFRADRVIE